MYGQDMALSKEALDEISRLEDELLEAKLEIRRLHTAYKQATDLVRDALTALEG